MLLIVAVAMANVAADEQAEEEHVARAHYLANAGVMIERGETKILFDPLFRNSFSVYRLVPEDMERALFDADPPWDGIDAVFISHYHDDHFTPRVMLDFLAARTAVRLFAPQQAVDALAAAGADDVVLERVVGVNLAYGGDPVQLEFPGLAIEAVRVPHSGWPSRMTDIENVVWRVTIDDATTVIHFGDADTRPRHFELHPDHWHGADTELALPPYWFFLSAGGRIVLGEHVRAEHTIGVHVPVEVPPEFSAPPLDGYDLFTVPGETREIASD